LFRQFDATIVRSINLRFVPRIPLGAAIADRGHALIIDNGSSGSFAGNNYDTETIGRIVISVPPDSDLITYTLSGLPTVVGRSVAINSGMIQFFEETDGTRLYTITSSTLEDQDSSSLEQDIASLSLEQRLDAENDMLQSLQTFEVELGPEHNDMDGVSDETCLAAQLSVH